MQQQQQSQHHHQQEHDGNNHQHHEGCKQLVLFSRQGAQQYRTRLRASAAMMMGSNLLWRCEAGPSLCDDGELGH
jgi:hypothetical protein